MYEPRFDADLLATLLNIPPSKTLLRRHLNTQFKQLVGPDVMQKKREATAQTPLSPSAKVKVGRYLRTYLILAYYSTGLFYVFHKRPLLSSDVKQTFESRHSKKAYIHRKISAYLSA